MKSPKSPTLSQNDSASNTHIESVPLLDLSRQNRPLHDEAMAAIESVCRSGWFVGGPDWKGRAADLACKHFYVYIWLVNS